MKTFNDILKSDFLSSAITFSIPDICIGMVVSLLLGLFIYMIYKKTFSGVMYSTGFALSLLGMTLVTTLVIMAVTSNVVLSLGMVGALSIVRFRAAIKEPMEIVFLFWAIAIGIVVGAGMIPLATIGSAIIGLILLLFANRKIRQNPYILILNCESETSEKEALEMLQKQLDRYSVKTKTVNRSGIEITIEMNCKNNQTDFVNSLHEISGVNNATLVSYNGDYMS